MRIISIDPGYERLGIAIIEKNPREKEVLLYLFGHFHKQPMQFSLGLQGHTV
jgi:Holliday junction resolvasome RuvABC endonuclease subunit